MRIPALLIFVVCAGCASRDGGAHKTSDAVPVIPYFAEASVVYQGIDIYLDGGSITLSIQRAGAGVCHLWFPPKKDQPQLIFFEDETGERYNVHDSEANRTIVVSILDRLATAGGTSPAARQNIATAKAIVLGQGGPRQWNLGDREGLEPVTTP